MRIIDLLSKNSINLNLEADSKKEAINQLVELMGASGNISDYELYKQKIVEREEQSTTGIGEGIAIPHAKTKAVKKATLVAAVSPKGIDYESLDKKATHLFFMIAAPEGANNTHLEVLSRLSTFLMDEKFRHLLIEATSVDQFLTLIDEKEKEVNATEEKAKQINVQSQVSEKLRILAVTACPTGIAHTFMAAEALMKKATELGISIKVETNGSSGIKNKLTQEEINNCDVIIIAADKKVEMARFDGKKVIQTKVADGIHKSEELIKRAINGDAPIYHNANHHVAVEDNSDENFGRKFYKHLMNGVSNMLPFVVGGGLLIALAFLADNYELNPNNFGSNTPLAAFFMEIGGLAFDFMLPVLAGFIAVSIADRPAMVVGFVGGMIANNGGSGFLGALLAGFVAGYIVLGLRKVFSILPESLEGIKPVLLYPVFGILLIGLIMTFLLNPPVEFLNNTLVTFLQGLETGSAVLLGIIVAGMMAIDMGGPINKAAYVTGIAALEAGNYGVMAAVMAGGMVPPLIIALATTFFKNKFTKEEQKSGKINYIMGLSFITEGAIPFAAADPIKVIPSCVIGASLAGALTMIFECTLRAPHGGIFVLPTIGNWPMYFLSIVIGSVIGAIILGIIKKVPENN